MKINISHVPVSALEPKSKKVLIQPYAAEKGKDKSVIIGDPHMPNPPRKVVTRKASDKRKANKTGGDGERARSDTRSRSHVLHK
jgi:hypothetical protein